MARRKKDAQRFLLLGLLAVFLMAIIAVFGMVVILNQGLATGSAPVAAENLAGDAAMRSDYVGFLVVDGKTIRLGLDTTDWVLDIYHRGRPIQSVALRQVSPQTYEGAWVVSGNIIPVEIDMVDLTATFTFQDGPVTAALRAVPQGRYSR